MIDLQSQPLLLASASIPSIGRRSREELSGLLEELSAPDKDRIFSALKEAQDALERLDVLTKAALQFEARPEKTRSPLSYELRRISPDDCVVFTKRSMLQYDMDTYKVNFSELKKLYEKEGISSERIEAIVASHDEQDLSRAVVQQIFDRAGITEDRIFILDHLSEEEIRSLVAKHTVIISLGGDDHTKAVSSYLTPRNYFLAINSDTVRSNGVITYFDRHGIDDLFNRLSLGQFLIEEWPRLEVTVKAVEDGVETIKNFPPVLSEVSIADEFSLYTFRGSAKTVRDDITVKGSGLLIATGVGSTGWFSSAGRYVYPFGRKFNRTERHAEFIVREPYGELSSGQSLVGSFDQGTEMVVRSSSKHKPEISGDSLWRYPLPHGSEAYIRLSAKPIKVISNQI